jgi:hypothetical protein
MASPLSGGSAKTPSPDFGTFWQDPDPVCSRALESDGRKKLNYIFFCKTNHFLSLIALEHLLSEKKLAPKVNFD